MGHAAEAPKLFIVNVNKFNLTNLSIALLRDLLKCPGTQEFQQPQKE